MLPPSLMVFLKTEIDSGRRLRKAQGRVELLGSVKINPSLVIGENKKCTTCKVEPVAVERTGRRDGVLHQIY